MQFHFQSNEAPNKVVSQPITFVSKSQTNAGTHYINIEREALGIHYCLEKINHYFSACEVSMTTDHKLLVAVFKKDVASLSHKLQRILLCFHQYSIRNLYQPGPQLFIAHWLSRHNNETNRDNEIPCMFITTNAIESYSDIPDWLTAEEIRSVTPDNEYLGMLLEYAVWGWPSTNVEVQICLCKV